VLGVALALFAVLTIAVPAGAATTTLAVKALNVTPRKVTGTAGQATATTVNWTISDSDRTTGSVTGTVTIRLQGSTPGTYVGRDFQAPFAFNQTLNGGATFLSSTARNSSYSYTFAIPRFAAAASGTWVVTDISVQDDRGHSLDAGDAALANFLHRSVVNLVELIDSTPPTFSNLALRLNTSAAFIYQNGTAATASYSLSINDQESGFWQASITLAGPNGATLSGGVEFVAGQFGGTCGDFGTGDQDAFCTVGVTIPPGTAAGMWSVSAVTLADNAGNTKTYAGLNAGSFVLTSDGVINAHDFGLTTNPVNNWADSATTPLTFTATGVQRGISTVTVSGTNGFGSRCAQQATTTPTTNADGSFAVSILVNEGETACAISAIIIVDGSGNASVYGTDYGAPDPGLTITRVPDTIAPTVSSAVLNPATISGPGNPGEVFVNAVSVTPIAPVNQFSTTLFGSAGNPLSGNTVGGGVFEGLNGHLQLFVSTSGLAAGTYTVGFTIVDVGGLQNTYGPGGLPVPGGPLTLTVTP
jgi:hypothetical protein